MDSFDDYVAQQAAQRDLDQAAAAERRKTSDAEFKAARSRATEFFNTEVMSQLNDAAKSLTPHVDTRASSEAGRGTTIGYLRIGGPHAPRKVELSVRQNAAVYVLTVKGAGKTTVAEKTVSEDELIPVLKAAIVDATDRWFATNDHKGT